jgi:hypothetical protein
LFIKLNSTRFTLVSVKISVYRYIQSNLYQVYQYTDIYSQTCIKYISIQIYTLKPVSSISVYRYIQSDLYQEVIFGTKKMWPYKIGDLLKEIQFIWNFLWQDKKKVTFKYLIEVIDWLYMYMYVLTFLELCLLPLYRTHFLVLCIFLALQNR